MNNGCLRPFRDLLTAPGAVATGSAGGPDRYRSRRRTAPPPQRLNESPDIVHSFAIRSRTENAIRADLQRFRHWYSRTACLRARYSTATVRKRLNTHAEIALSHFRAVKLLQAFDYMFDHPIRR